MKNIYLYGASDDCREVETDFNDGFESYSDIQFFHDLIARYEYEGDWGIWLDGKIPHTWKVKVIEGNAPQSVRNKNGGQGQLGS